MDELGFNKIAAAVLATGLGFMLIGEVSHMMMHVNKPDAPAYALEIPEEGTALEEEIELPFPQPVWIEAMDYDRGETVFKKCTSCHNAEKGGPNGTGPNLYGVVGAPAAQHAGFNYSSAMSSAGITWDYETLDGYLTKPTSYVSGTAMNFVGLKKEEDRAAVIEYLRQHADAPIAKPEPAPIPEGLLDDGEDAEGEDVAEMSEDAEGAAENAGETMTDMADDAADMAGDAADGAQETAEDAVDAAGETVDDTADAAGDMADDAMDAAGDTAEDAAEDIEETTEEN